MTIFTRADGTPYQRPEKPEPDADIEVKIAYMRALAAYHDEISNDANREFAKIFGEWKKY